MSLAEVTHLLDEGGQSLRFSRQLLAATFENIDAGISVVDSELNLIAWNTRYEDLFGFPAGMVRVGAPVADLIRHNALRGDFGEGDIESQVERRLGHLRRGAEHAFERRQVDGRVIKTVGGPMPGGGYVMSFTDITEETRIRDELERTLVELENRVAERTSELSAANDRLAQATRDKTRFLAAASHDLLQPLHAARLFTAALERRQAPAPDLVKRIERSIIAAEDLLRALLDISRLDAGGIQPNPEPVALAPFLRDVVEGARPIAAARGLRLAAGRLRGHVHTDPGLLRSVVQNFLSNALRYTTTGGVIVAVRRRGEFWRIDVIDTGVGIPVEQQAVIFGEFTRLGTIEAEGLGLGLAIVERIARLLGGIVEVASQPGRGSRFSLSLPASPAVPAATPAIALANASISRIWTVLVVDNDPDVVDATTALVTSLGHVALGAADIAAALVIARTAGVDAVLADYQLDHGEDGLALIAALRRLRPGLPAALITAGNAPELVAGAARMAVPVLYKPVAPDQIVAFLAQINLSHAPSMADIKPQ
jgi:PAS domain S-box-containing protein